MPLTVLFLAIALVLMFFALVAGFRLGRRYRVPAPGNHEENPSRECETQAVVDELSQPAAAKAAMPQPEPPPQTIRIGSLARKTCCRRQGHDR